MKFLCDVHISYKVVKYLIELGYETIHVNDILDKWYTKDTAISDFADKNELIVITKDVDFKTSYLIKNSPKKLIKINLGNITTSLLISLIHENIIAIRSLDAKGNFMFELGKGSSTYISKQ